MSSGAGYHTLLPRPNLFFGAPPPPQLSPPTNPHPFLKHLTPPPPPPPPTESGPQSFATDFRLKSDVLFP